MAILSQLVNLFFPPVCLGCQGELSDIETSICVQCRHDLPVTNFHIDASEDVKKVFYGRLPLENATALLRFHKKGIVQQLLHNLKYRGHEDIGDIFGVWIGEELKTIDAYKTVDIVIPVPLHKTKLKKRGYNQVEKFGKRIAIALNARYADDILIKTNVTKTQVFKKRDARWQKGKEVFSIQNEAQLKNKHILLVDDIITTGSTMEACGNMLIKTHKNALSIVAMAIA